jgi:hypothetical protein
MRKVLLLLVPILVLVFVARAFAQTPTISVPNNQPQAGISLTLSPTFLNLSTDPGDEAKGEFRVRNNNTFPEYLKLSVVKFVNGPEGPVIARVTAEDEFAQWISFAESEFVLNPNQNKTVRFTVNTPSSAALGYYYGIVVSRIKQTQGEGAVISGAPALPVLLEVKSPNAKKELQIIDFKTDRLFYEYLPTTFNVTFKNTGNVHVSPVGDIFIDSLFNQKVGLVKVNEGRGNILPEGDRTFNAIWDDGFAVRVPKLNEDGTPVIDDKGQRAYETKYDFSKANLFRFGKYTANLLMVYDNGERDIPVEARVSFWVIPWKILGVGLIISLLALVGLRGVLSSTLRRFRG